MGCFSCLFSSLFLCSRSLSALAGPHLSSHHLLILTPNCLWSWVSFFRCFAVRPFLPSLSLHLHSFTLSLPFSGSSFSLSACPAVLLKSDLAEKQENKQKDPFKVRFSCRLPQFCREMAQLQENSNRIISAFYTCTRSDGNCSPLSREELKLLIKQEFADAMEVRIQPHSWRLPRVYLLDAGLGSSVQHGRWSHAVPCGYTGHLAPLERHRCLQKPRICREKERLFILPVPAARRTQCRDKHKPWGVEEAWGCISALRPPRCS